MASLSLVAGHDPQPDIEFNAEADYLSACLQNGSWNPTAHGLSARDFPTLGRVYKFLHTYHRETGGLPDPQRVCENYPQFVFSPGYDARYSSKVLREDSHFRNLARITTDLSNGVSDRSLTVTSQAISDLAALTPPDSTSNDMDVRDPSLFGAQAYTPVFPTSSPTLNSLIDGGIQAGTLTVASARTSVGKSWWLMQQAIAAAAHGKSVVYFSLEMSARRCAQRVHTMLLGAPVDEVDPDKARTLVGEWFTTHNAAPIKFRTLTQGTVTPSQVAAAAGSYDVIIVDYAGLMSTDAGESHAASWNAAAEIVQKLKDISRATDKPVLTAAQLTRNTRKPTGANSVESGANLMNLQHTDKYGHDPDVVLSLHRMSESVTLNVIEKNRSGALARGWYTRFLPAKGLFEEIDAVTAHQIIESETQTYDD